MTLPEYVFHPNVLFFNSTQGNQVAIKYIKDHVICNIQKPSIIAEMNVVTFLMFLLRTNQTFTFRCPHDVGEEMSSLTCCCTSCSSRFETFEVKH